MGVIQFHVDRPDLLSAASATSLVDFLMFDGRVVPARARLMDRTLVCDRAVSESGQMRILWPRFDGHRQVMQTTSLREQVAPYQLELELARGQLSRLRNQLTAWLHAGMQSSPQLDQLVQEAHRAFRAGVLRTESPETSSAAALLCAELSCRASELLCEHYTEQRIGYRRTRSSRLPVFLGCHLVDVPREQTYGSVFNAVQVDASWDRLERDDGDYDWDRLDRVVTWALDQRLFVIGGPLLDLSTDRLPAWMRGSIGNFANLQSYAADFVETVVGRYVGRIRHWEVATGANRGGVAGLDEERRLNLVSRVVEAARQVDEHTQISLRVVQPWGEYLSETSNRLSPPQFVDTLRRCGVRLTEVNLELRFGRGHLGGLWRDGLALSQLLDHWSQMQLPINVMVALPERTVAESQISLRWLRETVLTCLSKERVVGIYCLNWNQPASPTEPAPLVRADASPDDALGVLQELSDAYWL